VFVTKFHKEFRQNMVKGSEGSRDIVSSGQVRIKSKTVTERNKWKVHIFGV